MMNVRLLPVCLWSLITTGRVFAAADAATELNIEDLVNVQVTSVSKKAQALSDAPAAIFVITHDDIKRSGVTSVPEALRMAPGVDVARINASKWAISARGFNGTFANKLLVLIDGRSVYTPAFSGVYWDAQDVLLEDVERIEVIRGPGATLWGANAVNGVINIITKHAEATQGGQLTAGGGSKETGFGSLRYGKQLGEDTFARAYVKGFARDSFKTTSGLDGNDSWDKQQGGFRLDSRLNEQDEVTVQGDVYQGVSNQLLSIPTYASPYNVVKQDRQTLSGWNLNGKLQHTFSSTAAYKAQFYYDHYDRSEYFATEHRDTFDFDFQHNFKLTDRQSVIWGLDYRITQDQFHSTASMQFKPESRGAQLFSGFVQDEWMLLDDTLWFTLGSKFEHNDYTGFEGQPTAKLMWAPATHHRLWASVSRAVRTPSRAESTVDIFSSSFAPSEATFNIPVTVLLAGNPRFQSEVQLAYEAGYRFTLNNQFSFDLTGFYGDYSRLRAGVPVSLAVNHAAPSFSLQQTVALDNTLSAKTYGVEMAVVWQMADWWRWDANYSYFGTEYSVSNALQNVSPTHKANLRSALTPMQDVTLDFWLRYTDVATALTAKDLNAIPIAGYVTLDMQLGWKPVKSLELSITGQNLLDDYHQEYVDELFVVPTEIARGVYGKVVWEF